MMDDGAMFTGRSKGLAGLMLVVIGFLWWMENYRHWMRLTRWFIPLLVILLGIKLIAQSSWFVHEKKHGLNRFLRH